VDDGSTNNTEEVVKSINDFRIRYIRHEKNHGSFAVRNTGIRTFLDPKEVRCPSKEIAMSKIWNGQLRSQSVATMFSSALPIRLPLVQHFTMQGLLCSNMRKSAVENDSVSRTQAPTPDEEQANAGTYIIPTDWDVGGQRSFRRRYGCEVRC